MRKMAILFSCTVDRLAEFRPLCLCARVSCFGRKWGRLDLQKRKDFEVKEVQCFHEKNTHKGRGKFGYLALHTLISHALFELHASFLRGASHHNDKTSSEKSAKKSTNIKEPVHWTVSAVQFVGVGVLLAIFVTPLAEAANTKNIPDLDCVKTCKKPLVSYDELAIFGPIILAVMAVLISYGFKLSQESVLLSRWRRAWLVRLLLVLVGGWLFYGLAIAVLVAVVFRAIEDQGSSEISPLLVAVTIVLLQDWREPCRYADIYALRENKSNWSCALPASARNICWNHLRQKTTETVVISVTPPLLVGRDDYLLLGFMLRPSTWKVVCACEKSKEEFRTLLTFSRHSKTKFGGIQRVGQGDSAIGQEFAPIDSLRICSKLLVLLENANGVDDTANVDLEVSRDLWYEHYDRLTEKLRKQNSQWCTAVIFRDLFSSDQLSRKIRSWDDTFRGDILNMWSSCTEKSGYWEVVNNFVLVRDGKEFMIAYNTPELGPKRLEIVYILLALQQKYFDDIITVEQLNKRRNSSSKEKTATACSKMRMCST